MFIIEIFYLVIFKKKNFERERKIVLNLQTAYTKRLYKTYDNLQRESIATEDQLRTEKISLEFEILKDIFKKFWAVICKIDLNF